MPSASTLLDPFANPTLTGQSIRSRPAEGLGRQLQVVVRSLSYEGRLWAAQPAADTGASAVKDDPKRSSSLEASPPESSRLMTG